VEDLTLRAGLRFDYFSARSYVPGDPANPANSIAGAPVVPDQRPPPRPTLSPGSGSPIRSASGRHFTSPTATSTNTRRSGPSSTIRTTGGSGTCKPAASTTG